MARCSKSDSRESDARSAERMPRWQIFRFQGPKLVPIGLVHARSALIAVEVAIKQFNIRQEMRHRLVARPFH
jgi:hypothetical protein